MKACVRNSFRNSAHSDPAATSRYTDRIPTKATSQEYVSRSADETIAIGRKLVFALSPPKLVLLRGNLGAGKTTLVKGIASGFQVASEDEVNSPTFTLIHEYRGPAVDLYHIDLYRVDTLGELETLGLDDLMSERSVLLIEWGEKFERFRRERDVEIVLEPMGENERRVEAHFSAA